MLPCQCVVVLNCSSALKTFLFSSLNVIDKIGQLSEVPSFRAISVLCTMSQMSSVIFLLFTIIIDFSAAPFHSFIFQ